MNDDATRQIAQAALSLLRPVTSQSNNKIVEVHFQPTDTYADSFVRAFRKGSGFGGFSAPADDSPIASLDIAITLKPGVMSDQWVGYTLDIINPETSPEISLFREWPEAGGEIDVDPSQLQALAPHILALLACPLTAGNTQAPRQSPTSMY